MITLYSVALAANDISEGWDDLPWFGLSNVFTTFDSVLSVIIGVLTVIAGLWFLFIVITGGIGIVTAAGNKTALEDGRKKITTGLIGLIVVIASVFLIDVIGTILGLDILGAGSILNTLTP